MSTDSFSDDFAMDDVDADHVTGGGGKLPEGGYKFSVTEVLLQNERGSCQVELEVLDAKDAGYVGRKHFEYLSWPSSNHKDGGTVAKKIMLAWCYAAKTTSPDEIKARQQARQGFSKAWLEGMTGRHILGFVKAGEYEGKAQAKISGAVYALDDPKGKGIPGWVATSAGPATGSGTAAPASSASAAATPTAPVADPFAGLV